MVNEISKAASLLSMGGVNFLANIRLSVAHIATTCVVGFTSHALAGSPIKFENELIQDAIGKELTSEVIPGLPEGTRQQFHYGGCLSQSERSCEMGIVSVSFIGSKTAHKRIRAVFLERQTGRSVSVPVPYGQIGTMSRPVWKIIDGFAFRDEQKLGRPTNMYKPFIEMDACKIPEQPNVKVLAIGKLIYPLKGNNFITDLKPIYFAWRIDELEGHFVEIQTKGIECIINSGGHD